MTGRRLSKRDTSVTKRKELEDKQKKKAEEVNFCKEKLYLQLAKKCIIQGFTVLVIFFAHQYN